MRKTRDEALKTRKNIIDAARQVFYKHGVVGSSLEKIAQEAGVSRGAVYWHFENKARLFLAIRQDVLDDVLAPVDDILFSRTFTNRLDAIEASLNEFFRVIQETTIVRELFVIMISRCEYVDEFTEVRKEVIRPTLTFLEKVGRAYQEAGTLGQLRHALNPLELALDTWAFSTGLLHLLLREPIEKGFYKQIPMMIDTHMALRRAH